MNEKIIEPFTNDLHLSAADLYMIDQQKANDEKVLEPYSMPYFNKHSKTGVLLIHGFSASPHEMMNLTSMLEDSNYTVYSCLVDGHGVDIDYLNTKDYFDWYYSLQNGYMALKQTCDKIVVIGQSNGGLLAHLVAAFNDVDLVVLLAPAYHVKMKFFPSVKYFRYFVKYYPRHLTENEKRFNYNGFAIGGLYQMKLLQDFIHDENIKVNSNVQMIISNDDILLNPTIAVERVESLFTGNVKEILMLDNEKYKVQHIVTEDHHKVILDMVLAFMRKNV